MLYVLSRFQLRWHLNSTESKERAHDISFGIVENPTYTCMPLHKTISPINIELQLHKLYKSRKVYNKSRKT